MSDEVVHARWERFELTPEGAVWDSQTGTVWVADVHLGKGATYRQLGMPVPAGTTASNLLKLDAILARTSAAQLVVLGDLVHSRLGLGHDLVDRVAQWRERQSGTRITLIQGNHDARSGQLPPSWKIDTVAEGVHIAGVACCHHPPAVDRAEAGFCFAGHLHPAAVLHGPGRDRIRLPCFFARRRLLLLPAFGDFTGGADIHQIGLGHPTALFALAGQHVVPIALSAATN
jgi:uncharacterized protein